MILMWNWFESDLSPILIQNKSDFDPSLADSSRQFCVLDEPESDSKRILNQFKSDVSLV